MFIIALSHHVHDFLSAGVSWNVYVPVHVHGLVTVFVCVCVSVSLHIQSNECT